MRDNQYLYVSVLLVAACSQSTSPYAPAEVPLPPAEIWLRPLVRPADGHRIPDEAVVEAMKSAVDIELRSRLHKAHQDRPAGQYWFQYEARWFGDSKKIFFVGRPGKFPLRALDGVTSASIPEYCHVFGLYVPNTKTVTDFSVGGFDCPARL